MNHRIRQGIALGALAPMAIATLVACGGDDSKASDDKSSTDSSSAAADEPTEAAADGEEVNPSEFVSKLVSSMQEGTTSHIVLAVDGGGTAFGAEGDVNYAKDPAEMRLVMSLPQLGDGIEALMVDGAMYIQMPGFGDGKYLKSELDDPTNPLGDLSGQMDVREQFKSLEDALKSVVFVGEEDVDGEPLKHYTMVMDGSKLPNQQGVTMPDEINYEVWLDGDDRLRKLSFETAGTTVSTTLSDWGKKVVIRAPRDAQIMEMPKS